MRIALFEPDIPQNTGTILRLAACLGVEVHIIEPAGFPDLRPRVPARRHGLSRSGKYRAPRQLGRVRGLAQTRRRASGAVHHACARVLSRPRLSAGRRPAVRPRILGRARERASGGRGAAGDSDAGGLALAQCGDGMRDGGGRGVAADVGRAIADVHGLRGAGVRQRIAGQPALGSSLRDQSALSPTSLSVTVISSLAPSMATWPKNCSP